MKIGIIGAMQMEMDHLMEYLENRQTRTISGVEFVSGTYRGLEVVAAVSGIGKVFAAICTEAMILSFRVDRIINIGVAGTLCPELSVMDVALANRLVQHDMNTSALGDPVGLLSGINEIFIPTDSEMRTVFEECLKKRNVHYQVGTIATGDLFLHKTKTKQRIHTMFGAIAGEMEGASIGLVCYRNHVPFIVLRTISDGEGGAVDYSEFAPKAAELGVELVMDYLEQITF